MQWSSVRIRSGTATLTTSTGSSRSVDCVVVGGGLVGTSLAYELARRGATVVVVDRGDPGRASDAGAGILSPETNQDPAPGVFAVGRAAAKHYESLVERLDGDGPVDTGYARTGSILVAERSGDDATMEVAAELILGRGVGVEELDPVAARRHFPVLGTVRRALYNPHGRRVDGRVLRGALQAAAERRGVSWRRGNVTGMVAGPDGVRVQMVRTDHGDIATGAVALCGGAWTEELAGALRVDLPVGPLKGQIVHLRLPDTDTSTWAIVQPVLGFYLVPWPGGRVACGGTMEAAAGFDHRVTADGVHQLLRECLRTAPGLGAAELVEVRVGSRPVSADGLPLLGSLPGWSNVFVGTGHGAEGLLLGPLSAAVLAESIAGMPGDGRSEAGGLTNETTGDALVASELGRWSPERFVTRGWRHSDSG
jgi:D-amino-acid dehydrogenase